MRHKKRHSKINRFTSWRKATVKSMLRSLILYQAIHTTKAKAKFTQPYIDKLIHIAKSNTLTAKRRAFAILGDHLLVKRLFEKIAPLFVKRQSGYTRVIPLGFRRGDGAQSALFEFTEKITVEKRKTSKKDKPSKTTAAPPDIIDAEIKDTPAARLPQERKGKKPESPGKTEAKQDKQDKTFLGGIKHIFRKGKDKDSE